MKQSHSTLPAHTPIAAVCAALAMLLIASVAPVALAADGSSDEAVTALTRPISTFELGALGVSDSSYKFGEYNGLQKKGAYSILNFDVQSSSPYDSEGVSHWRLGATDLGLNTRALSAEYGEQGWFRFRFDYDELQHNVSDSYQTPYRGVGTSNTLTLPSNWLRPRVPQVNTNNLNFRALDTNTGNAATLTAPPTAAQLAILQGIRAADLPAFRNFNIWTKRSRHDANFDYSLSPQWGVSLGYKHELKNGTRPLGAISAFGTGGDSHAIIPELIDTVTDQFNLALNFTGDKAFGQLAYYGSVFDNEVTSMIWQDSKNLANSPSISTAPKNQFHELNFTTGYNFSPATKLVVNGAYSRNSQNDTFVAAPSFYPDAYLAPATSANALVITKSANITLTTKPAKDWHVAAAAKYNDRDNRTPVRLYIFQDIETESNAATAPSPFNAYLGRTLGTNSNIYNNRPLSKQQTLYKLDTDYRLAPGHVIAGGFEWEKIDRACKGTWIACADADEAKEKTLRAEWRGDFSEDINVKLAYARSQRKVDYNENAWLAEVPMANVTGTGASTSVNNFLVQNNLTGYGPVLGYPVTPLTGSAALFTPNNNIVAQRFYGSRNNVSEIPGMRRFNLADRNRDKLRAGVNWQATERLSFQGGVDYNRDNYSNSLYGLQKAKETSINFDSAYQLGEDFSVYAFITHENQQYTQASTPANINNTNPATVVTNNVLSGSSCYTTVQARNGGAKIDPCNAWTADSRNVTDTLGFEISKKKMLAGKLDMSGNVSLSRAKSDIGVQGGTYVNNPRAATAGEPGVFFIAAENLPRVTNDVFEIGMKGEYRFSKASALRMMYAFQRLKASADFADEGKQFGTMTAIMPSNERVSNYSIHSVGVSFVYRF
jgi:MtrB/PioB family decaheme-associated outer membrane protein